MKGHIGAELESGLVHTIVSTAANVADVVVAPQLHTFFALVNLFEVRKHFVPTVRCDLKPSKRIKLTAHEPTIS
jgi:hypothetical protein